MKIDGNVPGSFRDPSGFLFYKDGFAMRYFLNGALFSFGLPCGAQLCSLKVLFVVCHGFISLSSASST